MKILFGLFLIILSMGCSSSNETYKNEITFLDDVYQLIKAENFHTAEISDHLVILEDSDFKTIKELELETNNKTVKIKSILKEDDHIFFMLGGSVDDHYGILYTSSNSVNMEGISVLKRLSGNAYYYSTSFE
ncbi:hypothetical protein [Paenibacillus sp. FSL H8-0537]|uniref:hypothetical protein n=1 Tax=Paenibacillus sp. FSL H8-0537 TaxID=2921399 RepID=UPI003100D8E3